MKFYVLDENNNKVEAFDKEGVLALLEQAIADGSLENITANSAFVSKLKCCVGGGTYQVAFITQAEYNDLISNNKTTPNTYYLIIDDDSYSDLVEQLNNLNSTIASFEERFNNELENCSKKSEVRQTVLNGSLPSKLLYEAGEAKQIDLTSILSEGKHCSDTIGISGTLTITALPDTTVYTATVNFSMLWTNLQSNYINACFRLNDKMYWVKYKLSLGTTNILVGSELEAYNITDNTKANIRSIELSNLNIYYK